MSLFVKKILTFLVGSALGVALFFGAYRGVPTLLAEQDQKTGVGTGASGSGSGTVAAPVTASEKKCTTDFPPFFEQEKTKFIAFMNDHFKNAAPNSELLQVGLDRLKQFRATLLAKQNSFLVQLKSQTTAVDEIAYCNQLVNTDLNIAEQVFESYVNDTTYSKRSTVLAQKMSAINGKLRGLNDLLGQLDGYFTSFSNKLPAFTTQCLKK